VCSATGFDTDDARRQLRKELMMMHRARTLVGSNRTAQVNQIRGLLGELGLIEKAVAGNPGGCR
jgi:transposase